MAFALAAGVMKVTRDLRRGHSWLDGSTSVSLSGVVFTFDFTFDLFMERLIRFSLCRRWISAFVWTLTALAVLLPSSHLLFGQSATETAVDSAGAGSQDDTAPLDTAQRFIRLERWLAIEQERLRWYARVVKQLEQAAESVRAELPAEESDGGT